MIKTVLDESPSLKQFICGEDNLDFTFSELFMDAKADFNQQYGRCIIRCERDENIEFNSFWNTVTGNLIYTVGKPSDKRMPLRDADRM